MNIHGVGHENNNSFLLQYIWYNLYTSSKTAHTSNCLVFVKAINEATKMYLAHYGKHKHTEHIIILKY